MAAKGNCKRGGTVGARMVRAPRPAAERIAQLEHNPRSQGAEELQTRKFKADLEIWKNIVRFWQRNVRNC